MIEQSREFAHMIIIIIVGFIMFACDDLERNEAKSQQNAEKPEQLKKITWQIKDSLKSSGNRERQWYLVARNAKGMTNKDPYAFFIESMEHNDMKGVFITPTMTEMKFNLDLQDKIGEVVYRGQFFWSESVRNNTEHIMELTVMSKNCLLGQLEYESNENTKLVVYRGDVGCKPFVGPKLFSDN